MSPIALGLASAARDKDIREYGSKTRAIALLK